MSVPASPPAPSASPIPEEVQDLLASEQRDRARDKGSFNQYGMRDDPRDAEMPDRANPGTGDHARRFGAGGDMASYANRADPEGPGHPPEHDASSDAPAHKPGP